ncbi:whirlin isoform X2 [Homalodisca vitripennis]|uniref:whirlin isoform X2 n=1 Tax=Homalodisca vitripennis TaxID=197043 RepID=UPI001EECAFE7|nr:whirlin isoform X2 [Homalodisca vitripennis]
MTVRSPHTAASNAPGPWLLRQTYSWIDRQGRPVSPPLEYARASPPVLVAPPPPPPRWNYSRNTKDRPVRKVELSIEPGQSLGLMIRGGVEYNLGIFITGVDKDSVADRAGLMIGDQILEVNGQSFLDVTHDEAVNQLKFHKRMTLTVRDVGKVPHSCTAYDSDPWETPQGRRVHASRSAALQMVDEKARVVLKKSEFNTLTYYLDEYSARQMTIEAFVAVLLELLNTPEKYTLLTELREVVMPEDRGRFDELVYRRESEGQRLQHMMDSRHSSHTRRKGGGGYDANHLLPNMHHESPEYHATARPCRVPVCPETIYSEPEDFRTPSEDSGLGLGPELGPGPSLYTREVICRERDCPVNQRWSPTCLNKRTSDLALSNDEDYDHGHQEYGVCDGDLEARRRHSALSTSVKALNQPPYDDANMCGYLEGLRSHLGGWTQRVKSWYWGNPLLAHKLGRGFDLKEEQELLEAEPGGLRRHGSNMRLSRGDLQDSSADNEAQVVADQQGNLRITVKKTKPLLGIAIEGGANTRHPLPRIINIHENGAAFDAGGLEVGQLILEVDGHKVEGMQHQEVARLIAESFARRERQEIEFLVVEAKKSNLEPKPTALIFLEA